MQHCAFCGSELPPNARFCGHCGRTLERATGTPTELRDTPPGQGAPRAAFIAPSAALSAGPGSASEQEQQPRHALLPDGPLPIFAGASGQPLPGQVPLVQGVPALSQVPMAPASPSVLGGASAVPGMVQGGTPAGTASAAAAPSFAPSTQSVSRRALPQTGTTQARPAEPQPGRRSRVRGAARESLLGVPKGLLIALASFILVAGSAGAFVAVLHVPLPGRGSPHPGAGPPHAGGTTTVQGSTPHATACAGSNCTATTSTTTASHHTSLTVTFTGAVSGSLVPTSFGTCGSMKDSQGPFYGFSVEGTLQGKLYIFDIYVRPYNGPGAYTHVTTGGLTYEDAILSGSTGLWRVSKGTVIIASDEKSGTLQEPLQGLPDSTGILSTPGPAQVSGSWTCG